MATYLGQSLASGQIANSVGAIFTVAATNTAFVKTLTLFNTNAAAQTVLVYIKRNGQTPRLVRRYVLEQNEFADALSDGDSWQLSTGDAIEAVTTTAATVDYTMTGVIYDYT